MQPNRCPQKDREVCLYRLYPPSLPSLACSAASWEISVKNWRRFNLRAAAASRRLALMELFGKARCETVHFHCVCSPSSLNRREWLSRFVPEQSKQSNTHIRPGRNANDAQSNEISDGKCHICHVDTCERLLRYTFIFHPPAPAARRNRLEGSAGEEAGSPSR